MKINKVAVIGAGTMGAGIAGQVANAGVEVWLLDLPFGDNPSTDNPNALAERGMERLRDPDAPGLVSKEAETFIHVGNTRDNFDELASCDWIAEAVVERLDIKKDLYKRLDDTCHKEAIITSNTSTIPIKLLVEDMPVEFRKRFAITHFFNPVRFMRLLELVRGEDTDPAVIDILASFCEQQLGKGVVPCLDTPGFLGNRVGVFAIQCALHAAFDLGLTPQEADALFGRPMGIPKTGVFGLYDLIGIDLMSDVVQSLVNILPENDAFHAEAAKIPLMTRMIDNGQTGNKQGKGFYRDSEDGREVLNLGNENYQPAPRLNLPLAEKAEKDGVKHLLDDDGLYGQFAWRVLSRTLSYAASLIPEVGDNPVGIDDAMKLGYNWVQGPMELIDEIGVDYFVNRLQKDGMPVPEFLSEAKGSSFYRVHGDQLQSRITGNQWRCIIHAEGIIRFTEKRLTMKPENSCEVASWYDLDGMAMVEFHSKANALDADSMAILDDAITAVEQKAMRGLIVHNDAQHFSCGVNLQRVREFFRADDLDGLDQFLANFQNTVHRMAHVDFPVVAAPVGLSIGGGFEVVLHAKQVICHANSVTGLVESLVGVVPGGGGCKETLYRWIELLQCGDDDIGKACWKAFMNLGYGKTATSPIIAKSQAMLRANDRFVINRDRILSEAIAAIENPSEQKPFDRPDLTLPGKPLFEEMCQWLAESRDKGIFMPHDVNVGSEMARIVTGGDVEPGTVWKEQNFYDAERKSFLSLVQTDATRERINTMLDNGSPVRN